MSRIGLWLALLAIIALSIGWRLPNLGAFSSSNDEGAYLMWAWLAHSGHRLYSETVSVSAPLFIVLLDGAFDLVGVSLITGRVLVLGFLGLMLFSLAWAGRLWDGWLAGLVAASVFSLAPSAFALSRMAMGEIPAVALATLSLALALAYGRYGGWGWLASSGLTLGLSLLAKALNPLVVLPTWWLIIARHRRNWVDQPGAKRWGGALAALAVWSLAGLLPVVVCLLVYDPAAFYDQVVAFRFDLRAAFPWYPANNIIWLEYFVRQQWGIVGLALAGIVLLAHRRRWEALIPLGLWLSGALLTVLTHSPLFPHHTIILLPSLAMLAGLAVAETVVLLKKRRWTWSALGLAGGLAFLLALPSAVQANQTVLAASFGREADAIAFLKQITRPTDTIISDNLLLPFMAGRQTPPPLGDMAQVAINSGRQTSARLIAISEAYPVEAVANWALRMPYLADYMAWVEDHYLVRRVWDEHHIIYFGRKVTAGAVPNRRPVKFDDGIELLGFDAQLSDIKPGAENTDLPAAPQSERSFLRVTLYWTADRQPTQNYTVFVHMYNAAGELVTSHDGPPLFGYLPTPQWDAREIIPDRHDIVLPGNLLPGEYRLVAGMYDPATGKRLPVVETQRDNTELERVVIQ